jgi:CheY-like chemotaxis protein
MFSARIEMPDSKRNLLIVDDEPLTRASLTQIFAGMGHEVRAAEDGFSALSEIREEVPDVILSDLNMPGMSGFELLSVVRRRFPGIQVIAMSGYFSGDGVQPGVAADAFYEKGTSFGGLLKAMHTIAGAPPSRGEPPAPIWIARNGHDSDGEAYVMISCPECLRTFPQPLGEVVAVIQQAPCFHCASTISYAIVQAGNPASPQGFQSKPIYPARTCLT